MYRTLPTQQAQQQGQQQTQTQGQPQQPPQTPQIQAATPEQQQPHAQALHMMPGYPMFNMNYAAQMGMNVPTQNTQLAWNVARPSPLSGNTPQASRSPMHHAQQTQQAQVEEEEEEEEEEVRKSTQPTFN